MPDVEVWWARVEQARPEFLTDLNDVERERYAAYRRDEDKARFLLGVTLVRRVLGARMSLAPAAVVLDRACADCGRPHGKVRAKDVELSVTHSGDWIGIAVGTAPVGLDVERIAPEHDLDGVARMSLTPEEHQVFEQYEGAARARAFATYWTRKEAVLKASGEGITGVQNVVVSGPEEPAAVIRWDRQAQLTDLTVDDGYAAALAVLSPEPPALHVHQFRV
ncbi:4'-phosphopantetheinyl transferase superfamily protein [Kribbella sandramycini]|uniref:4'-phosphopantetheinyl transferase n=1 Tax=Kribbella sandramycini TaxID=60450 RepID=A0A7Y4KVE9_9ACTN|nr:4'-phosphopantetheinyl transferase superfamily protein [Kribbella sandramycini]MBB6567971.1 4'-phosphopantetheinyl transferase [Kribbella sandramycini]NOL39434.1 4'-phosphopantetheinyl transferase superfamily protein [Kribbella sandramycini]